MPQDHRTKPSRAKPRVPLWRVLPPKGARGPERERSLLELKAVLSLAPPVLHWRTRRALEAGRSRQFAGVRRADRAAVRPTRLAAAEEARMRTGPSSPAAPLAERPPDGSGSAPGAGTRHGRPPPAPTRAGWGAVQRRSPRRPRLPGCECRRGPSRIRNRPAASLPPCALRRARRSRSRRWRGCAGDSARRRGCWH